MYQYLHSVVSQRLWNRLKSQRTNLSYMYFVMT